MFDGIGRSGFCEQDVDVREAFVCLIVVRNTLFVGSVSSSRYSVLYNLCENWRFKCLCHREFTL